MPAHPLRDAVVVLAPGVVLERQQRRESPPSARLRAADQIAELGPDLGDLVARLTGDRLGAVLDAVLDPLAADARGPLDEQLTTVVAELVEAGFLMQEAGVEEAAAEKAPTRPAQPSSAGTAPRRRDLATDAPARPALTAAGRVLRSAGFSTANLHLLLSHPAAAELTGNERAAARHRLAAHGPGALPLLARAFVFDEAIDEAPLRAALGDAQTATLLEAGLLRRDGDRLEPTVRVAVHEDADTPFPLLVAHDGPAAEGRPDMVPGLHRPSITLAQFTPRRSIRSALDLGTGNGLQALLLATHAGRVVATDVNPRAVGYAGLNAGLNDVQLDLRVGSLLEPVDGETFDLLVSNPPYVLSPETELVFRDSGYPGDAFNQLVATSVADAVAPGGTAVVLVSWSQPPGDARPRPLQWLDDARIDADGLLVLTGMADAITEAASWNREHAADPDRYARQMERWLAWYATQGIEQIGYGALTLRRLDRTRPESARAPWRFALAGEPRSGPCGGHIERMLDARVQLADLDDAMLMGAALRLQEGCRTRSTSTPGADGWEHRRSVGIDPGLGVTAPLDARQERALWRLSSTGSQPVEALAEVLAPDELLRFVRGLVEAGFATLDLT